LLLGFYAYAWCADARWVYFVGRSPREQATGIWRVPANGGPQHLVVRFDATHLWGRNTAIRVQGERLYMSFGDQQGDVWMTEIAAAR